MAASPLRTCEGDKAAETAKKEEVLPSATHVKHSKLALKLGVFSPCATSMLGHANDGFLPHTHTGIAIANCSVLRDIT